MGGARAASFAIEPQAVPVIAVLTRRLILEAAIPLWFHRATLEVLEQLDARELGSLTRLLVECAEIRSSSITIVGDVGHEGWRAFQTSVPDPWRELTRFDSPDRLFGYLKRAGLGYDSAAVGLASTPNVLVMQREPADWLQALVDEGLA